MKFHGMTLRSFWLPLLQNVKNTCLPGRCLLLLPHQAKAAFSPCCILRHFPRSPSEHLEHASIAAFHMIITVCLQSCHFLLNFSLHEGRFLTLLGFKSQCLTRDGWHIAGFPQILVKEMEKIMLRGVLWKPQSTEQTYGMMRLHSVPVMQAKGLGKYNTQLKDKLIWLPLGFQTNR